MARTCKTLFPVLALGLAAYILLAPRGLAPLLSLNRYALLCVQSGSMAPALPVHAVITVDRQQAFPLNRGDIITYRSGDGRLITHRVVGAGFDGAFYYITKGDANLSTDPYPVRENDIFGRVIFVTPPKLAAFIRFLSSPTASRTVALLFLLVFLRSFSRRRA